MVSEMPSPRRSKAKSKTVWRKTRAHDKNGLRKVSPLNKEYRKASESFIALEDLNHEASSRDPSRRDFLKLMGFSFAVSALSACSTPPRKVIPYLVKPEEITPGVANGYASTCAGCSAGCGVLVKSQ